MQFSEKQMEHISGRVLSVISRKALTQKEFAAKLGVDAAFVSHLKKQSTWKNIPDSVWKRFDQVASGEIEFDVGGDIITKGKIQERRNHPEEKIGGERESALHINDKKADIEEIPIPRSENSKMVQVYEINVGPVTMKIVVPNGTEFSITARR